MVKMSRQKISLICKCPRPGHFFQSKFTKSQSLIYSFSCLGVMSLFVLEQFGARFNAMFLLDEISSITIDPLELGPEKVVTEEVRLFRIF